MSLDWKAAVYTFCDVVENHVGMEKIGAPRPGLTLTDLQAIQAQFESSGVTCELLDLRAAAGSVGPAAWVLLARNAIEALDGSADLVWQELKALGPDGVDTQFLNVRRKVVQNKRARWNFNVTDEAQGPDIAAGKGTVHTFDQLGELGKVRAGLGALCPDKFTALNAEANIYYSLDTGIGFHGDGERALVIGICVGSEPRTIEWQAFDNTLPVGARITRRLEHGDVYFMEATATGHNWAASGYRTSHFRHRAGFEKWLAREERANQRKWAKKHMTLENTPTAKRQK